jgi:DNA-binding HxlR family transcriptional regulator
MTPKPNCELEDKVIMVDAHYLRPEVISMSEFSQDEIVVLKKINALGKATPNSLAQGLGSPYTAQDLSAYLKSLEQKMLLNKTQEDPSAYKLTPLGLIAIGVLPASAKKVYSALPQEKCFHFYTGIGPNKFTKMSACSLSDFKEKAKRVDPKSLEFHVKRGDFAKWCKDVLGDAELAKEFERLRTSNLYGEVLRTRVTGLIDARVERLTSGRTRV